jgi:PBSX family phage terminase large subunit
VKITPARIDWKFSNKHLMIMNWWLPDSPVRDRFGIILDGAIRSGKSLPGSISFVKLAFHRFPQGGGEFFIAGKTIHAVVRNIVRPLIKASRSIGYKVAYKRQDNLVLITNSTGVTHNFYLFGGHDEASQDLIQGFTAWGGFFDEAPIMPKSFVDMAMSRLSIEGATVWFTSNPLNPGHWFKKDFIDRALEKGLLYLHLTMNDNLSLSERVKARYRSLFTGVFFRRYILGEWCAAEGLIYPEFADREDLAFDFDGNWGAYGEMFVACDYGIQNAQVYLLFAYHTKRLRWEIVKEWYHFGRETEVQMTDAEYYRHLVDFVGNLPVRDIIIDPSAASFISVIHKGKRFRAVLASNEVVAGIGYTASLFHIGKLAISRDCEHLIEEMGGYVWDEKKAQRTGEEAPVKIADHGPDALRYGCATHIRRYEKRYGILISREAA